MDLLHLILTVIIGLKIVGNILKLRMVVQTIISMEQVVMSNIKLIMNVLNAVVKFGKMV